MAIADSLGTPGTRAPPAFDRRPMTRVYIAAPNVWWQHVITIDIDPHKSTHGV
jgi:hypothetical protein